MVARDGETAELEEDGIYRPPGEVGRAPGCGPVPRAVREAEVEASHGWCHDLPGHRTLVARRARHRYPCQMGVREDLRDRGDVRQYADVHPEDVPPCHAGKDA